jgi:hypothetical protein
MTDSKKPNAWRFYRSNLSTKVWNPAENSLLADFSEGTFYTEDPKVARILRSKGYPEIGLEDEEPPDIIVTQPTMKIEGDVPILGKGVSEELGQATIMHKSKKTGGPKPLRVKV